MTKNNYYEILEVKYNATHDEIKKSYRRLAMKYHPDRNPQNKNAENKFKEIQKAYEILSNVQKRTFYSQFGDENNQYSNNSKKNNNFTSIFNNIFDDNNYYKKRLRKDERYI